MSRPYFKQRIHELEAVFAHAGSDRETLLALRDELAHRKTPRASALLGKVISALERAVSPSGREASKEPSRRAEGNQAGSPREAPPDPAEDTRRKTSAAPEAAAEPPPDPRQDLEEPQTPELSFSTRDARSALEPALPSPDPDALLAAWTTLEVLEPQPLPKPRDLEAIGQQMIRATEHPEPWREERYGPRGRQRGVYWFAYLGELSLAEATSSLLELFPDQSPEKARRQSGTAPMAVVVLDGQGRPAEGKTFLSSFAWGYGKVRTGELHALAEFPEEERRLCDEIERELIRMDEEGEILPVTPDDLDRLTLSLIERLGLPADQVSLSPVFVRVPVWSRVFEAPEPELLNSFFLEDLHRVRMAMRLGEAGPALRAFLSGKPRRLRVDVVRGPAAVDECVAPERLPLSRWPVAGRYPLVMMQQAAVNHVARELSDAGLVGINGPPGTGKTTLLRDVVAKVVLDRSRAMAAFDDPQEAFSHVTTLAAGRGFLHLYELDRSLLGHEIVVASSNNKAVENVSREIPARHAIADDLEPPLRYFASVANRVAQGAEGKKSIEEGIAWGLAAAVLGKAANRRTFSDAFWWDKQRSMQVYLRGIAAGWDPDAETEAGSEQGEPEAEPEAPPEVLFLEDAPRDRAEALERWREARTRFRQALQRAKDERHWLEEARQALSRRSTVERDLETVSERISELEGRASEAAETVRVTERDLSAARRRKVEAVADRDAVQSLKPGFFVRLFRTRRFREWAARMARELASVRAAREIEQAAEEASRAALAGRTDVESRLHRKEGEWDELEHTLAEIRSILQTAQEDLGENLPDRRFWSLPEEGRQKLSPWLSQGFQAAREDLFAACFALHRAFIDAAAPRLRHNLGAAMLLLRGRKLSEAQEPARRSLWASLCLVVPVISTTFASVSRMFGPLGREQIGWLLIDEAGQAAPQAAVGAIWRSRRVIGIGDPMQIPPVVTMSERLIQAILTEYGVDPDAWAAPLASVQSLADRASWFGTTLLHEEGDVWVGSPLRVHRRCQEPMFQISNRIAYDGLMVQATPSGPSPIGEVLGESAWFHLEGSEPGHWSPPEGELAADLLTRLLDAGVAEPDIFFITPFRLVQSQLRKRLRQVVAERVEGSASSWVNERIGTIHTFQGKEAEAVVLVLGAPSPQAAGARHWAGGTPNLLNVAVSRAKRRLYVIGDRRGWKEAGVFRTLALHVPSGERP